MSKYTTEVRFICENACGYRESQNYNKVEEIIAGSLSSIFDFNFPIFDENYRSVLETKILRHYYTREIGLETVGLWKHFLCMRLNEIMPYYNKLYNSELIEFNPMYNVKYDTSHEGSASGTNTDTDNGTNSETDSSRMAEDISDSRNRENEYTDETLDKFSDTPQGGLTGVVNDNYLTTARKVESEGTGSEDETYTRDRDVTTNGTKSGTFSTTKNGRFNNTDEYLRHVEGNNGSKTFSELLMQYRETFINIDMMIINDLNDLFMGVW